ncbi:MAG: biopolymer transporter ExbD, partial [Nitrospirae bacterium]|nr:biopolymer transporter ExbD [Nitrospirota bacterium]
RLPITRIPKVGGNYDLKALSDLLLDLKSQYPKEKSIVLLSEPQIPYESLVEVMDTCRSRASSELYPDVTLGEVKKT